MATINEATMRALRAIIQQELSNATSIQAAAQAIAKGVTQYIGARYVPLFAEPLQWDSTKEYEPLTIVLYQGNSYTTRQYTPAGIDITNEAFWAETGNYNAQIEQYRQEVKEVKQAIADEKSERMEDTETLTAKVDVWFDTVADMKVATNLANGMTVHTNGFHSVNDGGAAFYRVSDTGTANEMDVIGCQNSLIANLIVNNGAINIDKLGAKGNEIDDDFKIIQYAISNYRVVSFGKKTYVCESTIILPDGVITIFGVNARDSVIKFNGSGMSNTSTNYKFINISNIFIKGNGTGTCIELNNAHETNLLDNCVVDNFETGLRLTSCYLNSFTDSIIVNCSKNGVNLNHCVGLIFENGQIYNKAGVSFYAVGCLNIKIIGTDISAYSDALIDYAIHLRFCVASELSPYYEGNNAQDNPAKAGIYIDNCISTSIHDISVSNFGTKPSIEVGENSKETLINNVSFQFNSLVTDSVGIKLDSTAYETNICNCYWENVDTFVDVQANTRTIMQNCTSAGRSTNKIKIADSESTIISVHGMLTNNFPALLNSATQIKVVEFKPLNLPIFGSTTTRDSITPAKGIVYLNTTTGKIELYNGTAWQQFPIG